jgi:hypothetical protein
LSYIVSTKQVILFVIHFYVYFINADNEIKKDKIDCACDTHGEVEKYMQI